MMKKIRSDKENYWNSLGKNNIFVKIPIVYTTGESTLNVIKTLVDEGIKLNITAIFLLDQRFKKYCLTIKNTSTILSALCW